MKKYLIAFFSLFLFIGLTACSGKKVEVEKLFSFSASGADGYGKLSVTERPDYILGLTAEAAGLNKEETDVAKLAEVSLKNAEKVTALEGFLASIQTDMDSNAKLGTSSKEFTCEGLKELKKIDEAMLKDGYQLDISGALPKLTIVVNNQLPAELKDLISYEVIQNDNKVGGNIIVKAQGNPYSLENAGYIMENNAMEFTMPITTDNVPQYITDISQLDSDSKNKIVSQMIDLAKSTATQAFPDYDSINSVQDVTFSKVESVTMMSLKSGMEPTNEIYNSLVGIMKVKGKTRNPANFSEWLDDDDLYIAVGINNILRKADGNLHIPLDASWSDNHVMRKNKAIEKFINKNAANYTTSTYSLDEFAPAGSDEETKPSDTKAEDTKPEEGTIADQPEATDANTQAETQPASTQP